MRIECSNCNKIYNIPDERLPDKERIAFPCPACKAVIAVDLIPRPVPDATPPSEDQLNENLSGYQLKQKILKTVQDLPPMPQTVLKAREIMADANSSFEELAGVLQMDQAIAAKVIRIANSAYYGLRGKVSSMQHAAVLLGLKTLEELITVAGTGGLLGKELEGYEQNTGDLWQHSLGVAFGSKVIATMKFPALAEDAFTAGLLHDTGKLALDPYILERKDLFRQVLSNGCKSFLHAEKQILGFDHSEIASEICRKWNIPQQLTTAIRYHHTPSLSQDSILTYIVHTADVIAIMSGIGTGMDGMRYSMDEKAFEVLGLQKDDTSIIMIEIVEAVRKITDEMALS